MKWGVRRWQYENGSLTPAGRKHYGYDTSFAKESTKTIKVNSDGSKTIPKGFTFNRVGQSQLDVNKSGALYMSYGKEDAARYVKNLGPTLMGKLLHNYATTVQHLTPKEPLKMASDEKVATLTAELLSKNKKLLASFNESLYSTLVTNELGRNISERDIEKARKNPKGKEGQTLAYALSSMLGDETYKNDSKVVYDYFRKAGYDAIPDVHDTLSGTSKTAMIVINPSKMEMASSTYITKDVMKNAKAYVKTLERLKVSELIA